MSHTSSLGMVSHWADSARVLTGEVSATLGNMFSSPSKGAQVGASMLGALSSGAVLLPDPVVAEERPVVENGAGQAIHASVLATRHALATQDLVIYFARTQNIESSAAEIEAKLKGFFQNKFGLNVRFFHSELEEGSVTLFTYMSKSAEYGPYTLKEAIRHSAQVVHQHKLATVKPDYPKPTHE